MLKEIELGKYYRHKNSKIQYHILTWINTKAFGMTVLAERYNGDGSAVVIIPINKQNFDNHAFNYEEIKEDEFAK